MSARTIFFPPEMMPEGLLQIAQHDTPELVFQPKYMLHPNGAVALTELVLCCDHPKTYIDKYERITGHMGKITEGNYYVIDLGSSKLL
jgi:hypothetical protein